MGTHRPLSRLLSDGSTYRRAWSVLLASVGAALLLCHATPAQAQSITISDHEPVTNAVGVESPTRDDAVELPDGASEKWWAGVQAMIRHEMEFIAPAADPDAGYQALNAGSGLQIHFPPGGGFWVTAAPVPSEKGMIDAADAIVLDWKWGVRPERIRIGDAVHDLGQPQPAAVSENRLEQRYTVDGGSLTEWFVNEEAGLRQNFTLDSRPAGPADKPLVLELAGAGALIPSLDGDGQVITLRDDAGNARLHYRDLTIYDANGETVPGHFALGADAAQPGALAIMVDDAGAIYPLTIDPLTGSATGPDFIATGEATNNNFGWSVAEAGDVNGDGNADFIVGALNYSSGTGRAYVYHGGASGLSARPAFTATGEVAGDRFGYSVAGAGDVNGDGYADVIVAADGYGSHNGRVYVYHGGASGLNASPAFTATGEAPGNYFGWSVAGAGDVNGDGYADVIVGADGDGYSSGTGRAYVYHGGASGLNASPAFTATGEGAGDYFGISVAGAGDVNGDGYADVIVGAYAYSGKGRAYVYQGGTSGLSASPAFTATGEVAGNGFGGSVAGAGDVNGDGYADVIVGAYAYSSDTGRVYVYQGGASGLSASPVFTATGEAVDNFFGRSVAGAGDVNGDGYADVIVGADGHSGNTGRAYVYQGGASGLSASPAFTATGEAPDNDFGYSVAGMGDVNGDGYADVIVGADGYSSNTGRAYVYHGGGDGLLVSAAFTATGEATGNRFGWSVAGAGDVNGDSYADVIVGAPDHNSYTGRVYVYHGGASGLSASPTFTATGEATDNWFGRSVSGAGDVNGDGYADVIVGALGYNSYTGRVYVYHGGPGGLSVSTAFTATGENTGDRFGGSAAGAGDVNGDGYADVIVGAWGYNSATGRAYVYHGGGDGLNTNAVFTATGEVANSFFGTSVAGAGNFNGDGYGDVIVGAPGDNSNTGWVYVFRGGANGLSINNRYSTTLGNIGDQYGYDVAGAGDVNGDGYADVVIGAPRYNSDKGLVYVIFGGVPRSRYLTFTATGEYANDRFGDSVAGAGDVNGDGYADIIVGASGYDGGTFYDRGAGRVYVYQGGANGLSASPAFTATGQSTSIAFGDSVAGAGDVNGDGYADIIVGAPGYSSNTGQVYVYQGGDGRAVLAQQLRGGGSAVPVQAWGHSGRTDGFDVQINATSPAGRQQVKLQVEACPPGVPLGNGACVTQTSPAWTDVTTSSVGVQLTDVLTGLRDGELYRWRARVLYAPFSITMAGITAPFYPAHGPWRRLDAQALEADIRVQAAADVGIVKTVTPLLVVPGAAITYTLSFSNAGPGIAYNVSVTDSVPAGVAITGVVSNGVPITQTSGSPNFAWAVGNLAAGAGGVITLAGTVDDPLSIAGFTIVNTAAITAGNDITPTNNVAFSVTNLKKSTQTSVQSSRNPAPYGETVTITASVVISGISVSSAAPSPTGQVRFGDETGELATVNLVGGLAAFSRATWAIGTHTVTAEYLGDTNFIGSTSPPVYQTVLPRLTARNDAAGTLQGQAVQIDPLANDVDPAGDGLVVDSVEQPASGSVAIDSGGKTVTYTPDPAFSGVVTFTYTARDSNGAVDDAMVAVVVSARDVTGVAPQIGVVNNESGSTHDFDSGSFQVQVQIPAGSYPTPLGEKDIFYLAYTEVVTPTGDVNQPPDSFTWAGMVFHLSAFVNGTDLGHFEFPGPVTIVITYDPALLGELSEWLLTPYYWNGTTWAKDGLSITHNDTTAHRITIQTWHLSEFALFSQPPLDATSYLYLPAVATVSNLVTTQEMPGDAIAEPAAPAVEVPDGTAEPDISAPADVPAVEPTPIVADGESLLHLHLPLVAR